MVTAIALEPVSPGSTFLAEQRYRPAASERPIMHDSTQHAAGSSRPDNRQKQSSPEDDARNDDEALPDPLRSGASKFAAAVIAGALPPTPQSMEELIRRIGSSEIPPESQARLKDIIA
ncbi:MAG: hypothetical protein KIT02_05585 [Devosia sp.]|uniref:hypothetical protein n=1 Tax=Devosia sp. TaxID=1871048 RepID=UPI0024CB7D38|nr:hypothetical protein [Devosia sp.]UYO00685.1 MAG: hypothetical protein KIT02_05585 [Devosia sp.]